MTTKRLLVSATQEKAEVPPSALFDALTSLPLQRVDLMIPNSACVAIRKSAHREGVQAPPPKKKVASFSSPCARQPVQVLMHWPRCSEVVKR